MASEIISIIAVAVEYLFKVDQIQRQFSYMWNHDSNFEKLKTEVEMLKAARDRVQNKADHAKSNNEEIDQNVEEWLNTANTVTDEIEELIKNEDKAKNNCFMGLCLDNFMTCCGLSREASRKVEIIGGLLKEEEEFDNLPLVFESRRSTLEEILNALRDPNVNRIGVYGLPGVGKTTLAEDVGRLSKKDNLFDVVVFEKVTKISDAEKIQEAIADKLGLESSEEKERKKRLFTRLKNDKKILIILDNIWNDLDLEAIGIPSTANQGGCKVLLTTRDRSVLERMDSKPFNVGVLNGLEAWNLFVKKMGDHNIEENDLKSVATDVVNECRGLPIAIITIASALRHKDKVVWKNVLRELRRPSPSNFEGVLARAYLAIELSYNNLRGEELKKFLLLCSLMPYHASTLDLLKYSRGLGILQGVFTMEEARVKVNTLVRELKDSCLLLDSLDNEWFSMHDFIREVAISIAFRDEHIFTVRNEIEWEWPDKDKLKLCTKIWIYDSKTSGQLIEGLECPKLECFLLGTKDNESVMIPDNFFKGMTNLKVLDFTNMQLPSLPSSIHLLKYLQTLCLDRCRLGDLSLIGNLTKLKILSFGGSNIIKLPQEIGQLTDLRLLDLTNCSKLKVIPQNVISRLSLLEEFYLGNTFIQWEIDRVNNEGSTSASLDELKHLSNLTTLEIHIKNDSTFPKGLFSKRLERYQICIGDDWRWFSKSQSSRTLKLKLRSRIFLDELQGVIRNVEDLYLDEVQGVKNVLYQLDDKGFPHLKNLHIQNNPQFLCIVDSMDMVPRDAFPLLKSLYLRNLINLEKIWLGQLTTKSFCKLKIIEVIMCPKLKNIFPLFIAKGLPQLQTIEVNDCLNMEEVLCLGGEAVNSNGVIERIEFSKLRFLKLKLLPRFTSFCSKVKTRCTSETTLTNEIILETELETPTSLFNGKVMFPSLESLELSNMNFEKIWHDQPQPSCLQNLTRFIVHACGNLKHLFSSSMVRNFVQLQHLEIVNCPVLEEIVKDEGGVGPVAEFVFPRVTSLKLGILPKLRSFYPGKHTSEWKMLKKLEVYDCNNVKIFASISSTQENINISVQQSLFSIEKINRDLEELMLSGKDAKMICQGQFMDLLFYRLKVLKIFKDESTEFSCGILQRFNNVEKLALGHSSYEEIFSDEEGRKNVEMFKQIKFLEISMLPNLKQIWKQDCKTVYSTFQQLETLRVLECDNLINLVPCLASLKSLTELVVQDCNGLINLVTSSTAKAMVQLRFLRVYGCKMMTEIVADEGDVEKDEIIFNKLQFLHLGELQSLESFCSSGKYHFNFPCLKILVVEKCHKMKTFSEGALSTPRLQELYKGWNDNEGCWEGDLNTTIQRLHNESKNKGETSKS